MPKLPQVSGKETIKALGTLRNGILKPTNLSVDDFVKLLKK